MVIALCRRAVLGPSLLSRAVSSSACSPSTMLARQVSCEISANSSSEELLACCLPPSEHTEIVQFIGAGGAPLGVTHDGDYPSGVESLLSSTLPQQAAHSVEPREIPPSGSSSPIRVACNLSIPDYSKSLNLISLSLRISVTSARSP